MSQGLVVPYTACCDHGVAMAPQVRKKKRVTDCAKNRPARCNSFNHHFRALMSWRMLRSIHGCRAFTRGGGPKAATAAIRTATFKMTASDEGSTRCGMRGISAIKLRNTSRRCESNTPPLSYPTTRLLNATAPLPAEDESVTLLGRGPVPHWAL